MIHVRLSTWSQRMVVAECLAVAARDHGGNPDDHH
jgi:hypothetical protein